MKKILNFITILILTITLNSCSNKKENTDVVIDFFNLESYLSKAEYVKLKMKKMPSGHLHLFGKLNGVDGNFILDTGAGVTVIEEKNKEKFKMQSKNTDEKATGAGGADIQIQDSENNYFKFENFITSELNLTLMNLDHVNNAFESMGLEKVDGVIGADILTNYSAIIDYSNLVLYLKK
ncbi:MAG: aspartyl protease family protein [Flavobacteriaceae bacterium]|nr:aspartyl protease family protein [Flavobacteriaceae bacterium]